MDKDKEMSEEKKVTPVDENKTEGKQEASAKLVESEEKKAAPAVGDDVGKNQEVATEDTAESEKDLPPIEEESDAVAKDSEVDESALHQSARDKK